MPWVPLSPSVHLEKPTVERGPSRVSELPWGPAGAEGMVVHPGDLNSSWSKQGTKTGVYHDESPGGVGG